MDWTLRTQGEDETAELGAALASLLQPNDVVSLTGDLGAGKTVLVKGAARALGVPEVVHSPTFNILVVHPGLLTLNHFDLYRLEHEDQLEDIDFYGVLESGGVSFVEWGERFPRALPDDHLAVEMLIDSETAREVRLLPRGERSERIARSLAEGWGERR